MLSKQWTWCVQVKSAVLVQSVEAKQGLTETRKPRTVLVKWNALYTGGVFRNLNYLKKSDDRLASLINFIKGTNYVTIYSNVRIKRHFG